MPWQKKFDTNETLDKAMAVFWSRGYEATSMNDLVTSMGINRGSFYDTYTSKRHLFIATLERYNVTRRRARLRELGRDYGPVDAIRRLFDEWIEQITDDPDRRGCFLTNTALELAVRDAHVGEVVANSQKETERFFFRQIKAGQDTGDISIDLDPRRVSRGLLAALIGLLVLARSRPEPALLQAIADNAMALLDNESMLQS